MIYQSKSVHQLKLTSGLHNLGQNRRCVELVAIGAYCKTYGYMSLSRYKSQHEAAYKGNVICNKTVQVQDEADWAAQS